MSDTLFVDEDGDVCIADGRKFNLVFCPAADDDGFPLCPDVVEKIVERYNAETQASDDLKRAWEMGRDAGAEWIETVPERLPFRQEHAVNIRAITPPADLAEKVRK